MYPSFLPLSSSSLPPPSLPPKPQDPPCPEYPSLPPSPLCIQLSGWPPDVVCRITFVVAPGTWQGESPITYCVRPRFGRQSRACIPSSFPIQHHVQLHARPETRIQALALLLTHTPADTRPSCHGQLGNQPASRAFPRNVIVHVRPLHALLDYRQCFVEVGAWRHGGMETWRHGGMEAWRHEGMKAWRHGGMEGGSEKTESVGKSSAAGKQYILRLPYHVCCLCPCLCTPPLQMAGDCSLMLVAPCPLSPALCPLPYGTSPTSTAPLRPLHPESAAVCACCRTHTLQPAPAASCTCCPMCPLPPFAP